MVAVNFTLTMFGNCSSISLVVTSPRMVGLSDFCSRSMYPRARMVVMVGA